MAKQAINIPQLAEELTPEWFTEILDDSGTVTAVTSDEIAADLGFMGEVYRCHLTWDGAPGPDSVIVKVPIQRADNFALGDSMKAYEREIVVYRTLRTSLGLRMPGFVYGEMDRDPVKWLERPIVFLFQRLPIRAVNWMLERLLKLARNGKRRRYVLVIEDVRNARPPTQLEGGSLDDVLAALDVLARFHAHNWMRVDAIKSYKRIWPLNRVSRLVQAGYVRNRADFVERFGERVGPATMAKLDAIHERVPEIEDALVAEPWTLLHGDYRLDNLLFRPDGEIVVLDYQGLCYGRPAFDVAYFITTALTGDHREHEEYLLRTYHDALVAAGVSSYPFEQLVADCESTKEMLAHRIVGAADILDTQMEGTDDPLIDVLQLRVLDWLD